MNFQLPQVNSIDDDLLAPMRGGYAMLWRRKPLILACVFVGLLGGYIHLWQQPRVYRSTAQVLVVKGHPKAAVTDLFDADPYVAAQASLVKSPLIVRRALNREALPIDWVTEGDPAIAIINGLTAEVDHQLLTLSFCCTDPAACRTILTAIIRSYESYLNDALLGTSEKTFQHMTRKAEQLKQELQADRERLQALQRTIPFATDDGDGRQLLQQRVLAIENKRVANEVRRAEVEAQLQLRDAALSEISPGAGPPPVAANPEFSHDLTSELLQLQLGLARGRIAEMIDENRQLREFGERQPAIARNSRRIESAQATLQKLESRAAAATTQYEIEKLRHELLQLERADATMAELIARKRPGTQAPTAAEIETQELHAECVRKEKVLNNLTERLQRYSLEKDLAPYLVKVLTPAAVGQSVPSSVSRILLAGCVLGAVLGLVLAHGAELTDNKIRSPDEIRSRLGVPVIGEIPYHGETWEGETGANRQPLLLAPEMSRSPAAEAYRAIRTALVFGDLGGPRKVVQIASSSTGAGTSTVAANLAVAVARVGKKTLLIDADLRNACLHERFGADGTVGIVDVLRGQVSWQESVQPTGVENLDLIACGPEPANPSELLSSPQLADLLREVRASYDQVLIDTSGLLDVSDPCVVAHHVDGIMLVLRIHNRDRCEAERVCEALGPSGGLLLGAVVTNPSGYRRRWSSPPLAAQRLDPDPYVPQQRNAAGEPLRAEPGVAKPMGVTAAAIEVPVGGEPHLAGEEGKLAELETLLQSMRADLQSALRSAASVGKRPTVASRRQLQQKSS